MPYKNLSDLLDSVKNNLPHHALEIYMQAFNHAWDEYADSSKRRGGKSQSHEEIAHKIAWAAVKKKYKKQDDKWLEKT